MSTELNYYLKLVLPVVSSGVLDRLQIVGAMSLHSECLGVTENSRSSELAAVFEMSHCEDFIFTNLTKKTSVHQYSLIKSSCSPFGGIFLLGSQIL